MAVSVRSAIPGRVRWDVAELLDRPELAAVITQALTSSRGVRSVNANPVTGRVLLHYDPGIPLFFFQNMLELAIRHGMAPPAPGPAPGPSPGEAPASAPPGPQTAPQAPAAGRSLVIAGSSRGTEGQRWSEQPLIRLLTRTPEHRRLATRALTISVLDHLFGNAAPALIGLGVDIVTRGRESLLGRLGLKSIPSQLFALGGLGAVVWTVDSLLGYGRTVVTSDLANLVQADLRREVYQHLQSLDIGRIEQKPLTEWMDLLEGDISRISAYIEDGFDPILSMATNGVVVAVTFIALSPVLAAVQLATIPGVYLASTKLLEPIRDRQIQVMKDEGRLSAILHDDLEGMATIANFSRQETEARRVEEAGARVAISTHERQLLSAAYVPAIQMAVAPGMIATLVYGGTLVSRNKITAGAYNQMGYSSLRLLGSLGRLGISIERYNRTKISIGRVLSFLERGPRIVGGDRPLEPVAAPDIRFEDVFFRYDPASPVLKGVGMHFPAGTTTGVVGATGAGKSTLLKLLLRFYEIESGAILINDVDIRDYRLDDLRRSMAMVPQHIFLFGGTIRENIAYGRPEASVDEVVEAARVAEASEFIEAMPLGYETIVGEGGVRLSGGQQQRIAIARAVLARRPIFLFDEATSAVDYQTEAAIQRSLREVTAGHTTVIIAHRLSTIRHADRIYVMEDGKVVEQGTHDELIARKGIYAGMWQVQTGEILSDRDAP